MATPSVEVIRVVLDKAGAFGLALLLVVPLVERIANKASEMKDLSAAYKYRLLRLSLVGLFGLVLFAGAVWTRTSLWPPSFLVKRDTNQVNNTTVFQAPVTNTTVGPCSPVVNSNNGSVEISNCPSSSTVTPQKATRHKLPGSTP